jgi:hypothetical protein
MVFFLAGPFGYPTLARHQRRKRRDFGRYATPSMASLRACLDFRVQSFGRFDEILDLVEKASALTLPDLVRCQIPCELCSNLASPTTSTLATNPSQTGFLAAMPPGRRGVCLTSDLDCHHIPPPNFLGALAPTNADICPR